MLIQGSSVSRRTEKIIEEYTKLLDEGIEASKILVLVQNSFKKADFIDKVKIKLKKNHFEEPQIHTFYGLAYNTVTENWPKVENTINTGTPVISPNLTGLEISQFFFKHAVKDAGFKDYNSKINLIHQLFRRNSLITNNNLSYQDVQKRTEILNETFAPDAKTAIDLFKKKTIEYRAFDYIRQLNIFQYVYKNTNYFENIEYLLLDDADEITNAQLDFITYLKPQLKKFIIGYDKYGSSRLGFLNTDTQTIENLKKIFSNPKEEEINLDDIKKIKPINKSFSFTRRLEMIDSAISNIDKLIQSGISPGEIAVITPLTDSALKFCISEAFDKKNIKYQYFSGSEKLVQTTAIRNTITLLNLSFQENTDIFKIRSVLSEMIGIPVKYCLALIENYKNRKKIEFIDLKTPEYNNRLTALIKTLEIISTQKTTLSEKIYTIYENLLSDILSQKDTESFRFFLKQIQDFEKVFPKYSTDINLQKEILTQLENSIISENPSSAPEVKENHIIISTAQKIIDFSIQRKFFFWLDTTSSEWTKEDLGTLYNAWVYQKSWNKDTFTYEDNMILTKEKTLRALRKLSLLSKETIYEYSSLFDMQGNENFGGIKQYLEEKNDKNQTGIDFKFIPRDDQKPVLDYKEGSMAISAVPGAGKTTILLALIIKLLQAKEESENIFVLTYMESAARNFKERIKKVCPSLEKLPNISTIHGLALRILKENSNFVKAGLDENFEVCDDNQRQKIIREIMYKLQIDAENFDKYEKAVSALKLSGAEKISYTTDSELKRFLKFYYTYNLYLKDRNIIDYDDMLVLSVKILQENHDIAQYYSNLCKYLIEDEAQDSSVIQQKLLNILSSKHKNLIRCGDVNQAITTTFTNADVKGFRDFIKNSRNVEMNKSQRCTKEVYELANNLIDYSLKENDLKNAFYNIKMTEVAGKNPVSKNALTSFIFEDYQQERTFILENIRKIFSSNPESSVALLVRNNYQIEEYMQFLSNYGYNVITRSDLLKEQPVFSLILSIIKFCTRPWDNDNIIQCAEILKKQKLLKLSDEDLTFLKESKSPFIMTDADSLNSKELSQFLWDMNYWLSISQKYFTDGIEEFALKIGNYYYISEIEKSNVYMIALLLKRLSSLYKDNSTLCERLEELSNRPLSGQFRFFNEEDVNNAAQKDSIHSGKIQIMTYHKSKGDEFDAVFIPQLTEENLPFSVENIKIKSKERFIEAVKALNYNYRKKDENELKNFQIEENLRLLYVAITRAKKQLFITSAKKYKKFSKLREAKPSIIFNTILTNSSGAI